MWQLEYLRTANIHSIFPYYFKVILNNYERQKLINRILRESNSNYGCSEELLLKNLKSKALKHN